ncbi:ESX secretion-associated protein EspG [Nocardia sp. CDC159]|uniref:ESX secretion-associated protein EspG n=1 Tax=Nocardia pulmonis TaxID=2951408 RepID=A0A9X2IZM1_9NOCA|nr:MULTISPECIES: ESX secretion-associated protein EspG [Nocardia]MCM6776889.1 ESX secretion-associated protein EspG [Nocardia pulmonis]MCM6789313.1 ESX secretion-associated protein EspG [Nocardia sp. CDC159]
MTVLGAGRGPSMLEAVPLSLDEMQFLLEKLEIDEVPVVLDAMGRYDNVTDHDAAMAAAAESLTARELLVDGTVHRDLADRLRALYRPHWVVALRWYVEDRINRFCLAKGDDLEVVALRGPDSYVIDEAGHDLPGTVMAALGPADPLELSGMNALTEELIPIFNDAGDATATAERLTKVGKPPRDAQVLASAMVEIHSHASIVGVVYGDGSRDVTDGMVSVYNTRHGRFLAITTRSEDDVQWTSLATGTPARLRTALKDLLEKLPLRTDFKPPA